MYDLTQDHPEILEALSTGFEKFHEAFDQYGCSEASDNVHEISAASYDGFTAQDRHNVKRRISL